MLTLVRGEDSDMSLYSSDFNEGKIYWPPKSESESETESSRSGKGLVAMWGEITLPELDIDDGDKDSEGYKDDDGDAECTETCETYH